MSARDVIAEVICGKYLSPSEGTYDKADDMLRALDAAGYAVVPTVATDAMVAACCETAAVTMTTMSMSWTREDAMMSIIGNFDEAAVWAAMLTASKETP